MTFASLNNGFSLPTELSTSLSDGENPLSHEHNILFQPYLS